MSKKRKAPSGLTIATYAVGFGDCFLLSFDYGDEKRHVLIDFGTTAVPKDGPRDQLVRVANDIAERTEGKLHAIVATHRHADHISGFATDGKLAAGQIIRGLRPEVVVQPWTEDPKAQKDARRPTSVAQKGAAKLRALAALEGMHAVAQAAETASHELRQTLSTETAEQLAFIGEDNVKNLSAVKNLMSMPGAKRMYVHFGSKSGLEAVLPGVKVHVLGPPTLEQSAAIEKQRSKDVDEFWHFWQRQGFAAASVRTNGQRLFPKEIAATTPPELRWFQQRLGEVYGDELLQLVTILDSAMNNTSVILLFEIGKHRLLFPGDAQLENWAYALSQPKVQKLLASTTLYKVGHHGSLNATPKKQLWGRFQNKSRTKGPSRLVTLLSTREDKHGSESKHTEVPRSTLLQELKRNSTLTNTLDYEEDELSRQVVVNFR